MTTSADLLLDTSAAIPLVLPAHERHADAREAVRGRRIGLAGHAAYETFSVLTRLPAPMRLTREDAARLIDTNFPGSVALDLDPLATLAELAAAGVAGGQIYDGIVGLAARTAGVPLLTYDARALRLYRILGVRIAEA